VFAPVGKEFFSESAFLRFCFTFSIVPWPGTCYNIRAMTAEAWVRLMEEMIDLKLQQFAEATAKLSPELSRFLQDKRETDRRRLDQIRVELVRTLQGGR
jgi:hypothetical protein